MNHVPLYFNYLDDLAGYSDAEFGRMLRALLRYMRDGELPELRRREMLVWPMLKSGADRARTQYERLCELRSLAGLKGAETRWGALRPPAAGGGEREPE